jgi:high-affinity nickel permease
MTWLSTLSYLGIGFAFGIKHALDADHLAASRPSTRERNLARSALVGGLWGIGHTIALPAAASPSSSCVSRSARRSAAGWKAPSP